MFQALGLLFEPLLSRLQDLLFAHPAYYLVLPEIGLASGGILILFLNAILPERINRYILPILAILTQLYSILATYHIMYSTTRYQTYALGQYWGGMETVDPFSMFWDQMVDWCSILVILMSLRYPQFQKRRGEFFAILSVADIPVMLMVSSSDLLAVYFMTEFTSIAIYVMLAVAREDRFADEALLKMFLIGSFSGILMLMGCAILYGLTGTTNFYDLKFLFTRYSLAPELTTIAMALIGAGLGFKIGIVPFHVWIPDIYQGAPSPVAAFISTVPKIGGICVWARFFLLGMSGLREQWLFLFTLLALLSIIVGSLSAIPQTNIKRMLGYSSIIHMGFVILGFAGAVYMTIQQPELLETQTVAFHAAVFYMFMYIYFNLGAWIVVALLERFGIPPTLDAWRQLFRRNRLLSFLMTVFVIALIGIPPTSGFFAKFYLFLGLILARMYWAAILAAIFTVVAAYFYIKILYAMFLAPTDSPPPPLRLPPLYDSMSISLVLAFLAVVLGSFLPQLLYNFATRSYFLNVPVF